MKNILLVDDHPFILDTYVKMLKKIESYKFEKFFEVTNIEKAISVINEAEKIDIAFFDISLTKKGISKMDDGIDLALYFKAKHPHAKIAFITMHSEFHILLKAIHLIKPEVFLSKNEVDNFTFNSILKALSNDKLCYSEEMLAVLKWLRQAKVKLDIYDFKIISLTSKGIKTKELTNYLPFSLRAIEKRKSNLKLIITEFEEFNN